MCFPETGEKVPLGIKLDMAISINIFLFANAVMLIQESEQLIAETYL